jgi:hypothetical protein
MHTSSICKAELHGLTLINIIVARFVGAGIILIRYSNGHAK